jgi:superfamily II DNA or RNA helicase
MDGKILILSSKQSTCDYFNEVAKRELPDAKTCSIYTNNKVENYKEYDVISATPAMIGTGEDIPQLRFMFNTEPGRSLVNTDQFSGRLRPYMNGKKATYYIEFIDVGFPKLTKMYKTRLKLLRTKVKNCYELDKSK